MKTEGAVPKETLEELRSEARFRTLFEQAAIGAAQVDSNTGRFVWINQRYCDIVGYSREEMQALDFQTITHPDDRAASQGIMRRLIDGQIPEFAIEKRYCHKAGQVVWVNLIVSPMWRPGETPSFHIAIVDNITELKKAEEALKQRAEELAVLNALGREINATLSPEQIVRIGLNGIRNAVRPDMAFLFLLQGDRLVLQQILPSQAAQRLGAIPEHRVGECLCGRAVMEDKPLFASDIFTDPRCTWVECKMAGFRSFAALPLRSGGKILGVIGLASDTQRDFEPQGEFLETLAGQLAACLSNAHLYETARKELAERLKVEKALRLSEEHYRLLFDAESDAIFLIDNESGQILQANAAARALYGYTPEEMLCKKNVDLSAEPDRTEHITTKTPLALDRVVTIPLRWHRKKNGTVFPVEITGRFFVRDGRPVHIAAVRDITQRLRSETALKESEERLRLALGAANQGLYDLNVQTGEAIVSEEYARMLDYDPSEFHETNAAWIERLHPDDLARVSAVYGDYIAGRLPEYRVEFRQRTRSGEWKWILSQGKIMKRDEQGRPLRMLGTHTDITERKLAEEAIREGEERFRLTFQTSPDAININRLDDGMFVDVNEGFTQLTGYTREDVIGKTSLDIDLWHDPAERQELVRGLQEKGYYSGLEARFRLKNGSVNVGLMSARILSLGGIPHIISIARDITERKRMEQERDKLSGQLLQSQKMEAVGRLAGGVAHDFNNMLQTILGHSDLALAKIGPDGVLRDDLLEISKAAERSADLTRQLLAFARKQTVSPRVLDMNDAVGGMLKMLRRLIGEDIELIWKPGPELWPVKVDPAQVDQILANLSVNARDAISGVGMLTIETDNAVLDETFCENKAGFLPGQYVLLVVSDNGCGMDKEVIGHLFEPFFTTKEVGKGTGLGLATVYGIVKQNNGFIDVYSEPGRGTTFKVYLPRVEVGPEIKTAAVEQKPMTGSETVLLVEDDEAILRLGTLILERHGYTVLVAQTPNAALALVQKYEGPIHLLVTDVVMPEMNGKDLKTKITALRPETKTLFMSGYTANVIAHHGVLEEDIHFLQKPFSVHALTKKVREVLEKN